LPYYETHEEVRKTIESNGSFEKIKLISKIYPFNSQILAIAAGNADVPEKEDKDYKGYVPLHREWQTEIDSIGSYIPHALDSTLLHTFREFISLARTSGAKVVVIYSPIFEKYYRKQAIGICNEICSAEGVPFWDFSRDTLFLNNRRLFWDVLHLNDKGAKIFSRIVAEKVKNNVYYIQPGDNLGSN
jgi:hypothetical protein